MIGGNKRFKQFLNFYELNENDYKTKLKSKAAQHYKILVLNLFFILRLMNNLIEDNPLNLQQNKLVNHQLNNKYH